MLLMVAVMAVWGPLCSCENQIMNGNPSSSGLRSRRLVLVAEVRAGKGCVFALELPLSKDD